MKSLNVVVADGQPIFIEGLRAMFALPGNRLSCRLNGVARTGNQLADLLRDHTTDILLLDLNLPETDGLHLLPSIKKVSAQTRVLVMTSFDDPRLVKAAFRAGADGYVLKTASRDELFRAMEEVTEGRTFLGRGVALVDAPNGLGANGGLPETRFARKHGLTRREIEIMRLIGQALTNKDIAEKLFISDQTVSVHRKNIMRKLNVNSTASLIKIAFENNLV
ncbi:MAG: response regulator transcription factor [Saprospiraceae bacterium]|nr:response regulator transcription factor [Saprospiraceae bacterium]